MHTVSLYNGDCTLKVITRGLSGHCVDTAGGFCVFTADSAVVKVYKCGFIDVLASWVQ